jgi:CO dehydrogenase maturation factor
MVRGQPDPQLQAVIAELNLDLAGFVPDDEGLAGFDLHGKATSQLPPDNKALQAAFAIFDKELASLMG